MAADSAGGNDTLRLIDSDQALDLTQAAASRLAGFEVIDITGDGANLLRLNVSHVLELGGSLRVLASEDDTVDVGTGWSLRSELDGTALYRVLEQANEEEEDQDLGKEDEHGSHAHPDAVDQKRP